MTAQETNLLNAFETTLTAQMNANDLTATVASTSTLATPAYLVIEPEVPARREYVLFDGAFTGSTFVASGIGKRYLAGSAAGSGLVHPVGSVVRVAPMAQHFEDLNDRIDALDHGADLAGLADDDHTQYSRADGTRAFTGVVSGVTPTVAAHLATLGIIDLIFPVGSMIAWPWGGTAPNSKWLLTEGQAISRVTYATLNALAAAGGYINGVGDGATTFNLPNLVGRAFYHKAAAGTGSTLGGTFGQFDHLHAQTVHNHPFGTIAVADHAVHLHQVPIHGHGHAITVADHLSHTHLVPIHGHGNSIGVTAHPAHTHDTNITHEHTLSDFTAAGTTSGPSSSNTPTGPGAYSAATASHTHTFSGSVSSGTGGGPATVTSGNPSASLTHTVTGAVTDAAAFATDNPSGVLTHSVGGTITDKAAFNTDNNASAQTHVVAGDTGNSVAVNTGGANPPGFVGLFIVRVL